jgi:hypothetical protein
MAATAVAVEEDRISESSADAAADVVTRPAPDPLGGDPGSGPPEQHLPARDLHEALPYLRRPFTPAAVRWKVQSTFGEKGCMVVGYIDARLVIERLNHVAGSLWSADYEPLPNGLMLCRLTIDGVTRQDVGSGYVGKGLWSDSLKRAAVHFGVGVSIYAIPQIRLWVSEHGKGKKEWIETFKDSKQKVQFRLTDKGIAALRFGYEKWLDTDAGLNFGKPIDHGDVEDSAGDEPEAIAAEGEVNDLPAAPQPLTDEKADQLRAHCRMLHAALPKSKMAKAAFESQLRQASTSHDELEAFAAKLVGLAA